MGQRRIDKRTNTGIRFRPETHQRLLDEAKARDVSVNWLVNRAVVEFLDHLIPVDEMLITRPRAVSPRVGEGRATDD